MVQSMTAFARSDQQLQDQTISCEIRSLNQRYLDIALRLPDSARAFEPDLRDLLRKRLNRGKIECQIKLQSSGEGHRGWAINRPLLEQLLQDVDVLSGLSTGIGNPDPLELLKWPGVLLEEEIPADVFHEAVIQLFTDTLDQFIKVREREGMQLRQIIVERLDDIDQIIVDVRALVPEIRSANKNRIISRLEEVRGEIDQSRLEQELVYLAQKADIEEELDRLQTHVTEVRRVLGDSGAIGRRLDFLMQELNREANTLSSKSVVSVTSLKAVDLKVLIEQMREQVQNIE